MCPTVATHFQFSNNKKITQNKENMHILEKENKILSFFFFLIGENKTLALLSCPRSVVGKGMESKRTTNFLAFFNEFSQQESCKTHDSNFHTMIFFPKNFS